MIRMPERKISPLKVCPCVLAFLAAAAAADYDAAREGRLRMAVVADYVAPIPVEVASQEAVDALISNIRYSAKTEQDKLEMFQLATEVRAIFSVGD